MKKWLMIAVLTVAAGSVVLMGNSYYQSQLDTTSREAMEIALNDDTGRALGNLSINRFSDGEDEADDGEASEKADQSDGDNATEDEASDNGSTADSEASTASSDTSGEEASGSTSSGTVSAGGLSEDDIVDTYFRQFERLQAQEQNRLEDLIQNAQADLNRYQAGESDLSQSELQVKYVERVENLEQQADRRFDDIHRELKTALEENGYETGVAGEFRAVYESEKETRRLEAIQRLFR